MKFYNSVGPNPKVVRMFMSEKGIDVPFVEIDLVAGDNRREPYTQVNVMSQLPALELDDGSSVCEVTAICEYLDEIYPEPPLIGVTPEERAETRMWTRRVDLNIVEPMGQGFRYSDGLWIFKDRIHCIPHAADDLKAIGREYLEKLNGWIDGKDYICGDRFTLADILLFVCLDFLKDFGQPLDEANGNIIAWHERVKARPSASA